MLFQECSLEVVGPVLPKYTYILHDGLFFLKCFFVDGRLLFQFSCEVEAVPVAFEMGPVRGRVGEGAAARIAG